MKKRNIFDICATMVMIAVLLQSCHAVYPAMYHDGPAPQTSEQAITKTPIAVYISDAEYINSTSRALSSGPFSRQEKDMEVNYANKYRNILMQTYALRAWDGKDPSSAKAPDYTKTLYDDKSGDDCIISLNNGKAGGLYTRLIDQYPDGETSDQEVFFYEKTTSRKPMKLYYNQDNLETGYNFFGYTFDKADVSAPKASRDRVSYDVTVNGTNDVMAGYAPKLTRSYLDINHPNMSAKTRGEIANIEGYSAYSSHRGVDPRILLRHLLTRIKFKAYPGNEDAPTITVEKIEVQSNITGEVVVAAYNLKDIGVKKTTNSQWLSLREDSEDGIQACKPLVEKSLVWLPEEADLEPTDKTPTIIGGSMMLMPADDYQVKMHFRQVKSTDGEPIKPDGSNAKVVKWVSSPKMLSAPKVNFLYDSQKQKHVFKGGYTYNVGIIIYGVDEIYITSNIDSWVSGGEIGGELGW